MSGKIELPYFDVLLDRLAQHHPALTTAFGVHVHWGYWGQGDRADGSMTGFAQAAERMSRRVCDAAGVRDRQSILDVGSGWGGTLASLDERLHGVSLTGLNIDARQIERARRRVRPRKGNRLEFVEGDACDMPFEAGSFDVVIALECAFHFADRARFLAETRRVLRPGGRLVVADFVVAEAVAPVVGAHKFLFARYIRHVLGPADPSYGVRRYRETACAHGLRFEGVDDITKNTLPTYDVLRQVAPEMGRHGKTARFGVDALELLSRMGLLRYVILSFEREAAAEDVPLPLVAGV
jgi:ubiquinone/menaquinone biosynthesis C-methylase UbiE